MRPGGLPSFGLRVSSDCDARSLARGVRPDLAATAESKRMKQAQRPLATLQD